MAVSPFARLFRSSSVAEAAAKAAKEEEKKDAAKTKASPKAEGDNADGDPEVEDVLDDKTDDAEDQVADPDKEPEEVEDDPEAKKAAKKAKAKKVAADGDDDSDDEDDKDPKAKAARARERGRIASIMRSDAAAANPEAALNIALSGTMSRKAAVGLLHAIGAAAPKQPAGPKGSEARKRLSEVEVPDVGNNDDKPKPNGPTALAAAIVAAGKKARGEV